MAGTWWPKAKLATINPSTFLHDPFFIYFILRYAQAVIFDLAEFISTFSTNQEVDDPLRAFHVKTRSDLDFAKTLISY